MNTQRSGNYTNHIQCVASPEVENTPFQDSALEAVEYPRERLDKARIGRLRRKEQLRSKNRGYSCLYDPARIQEYECTRLEMLACSF